MKNLMNKKQEKVLNKIKQLGSVTSIDKDFVKWYMSEIYTGDKTIVTKTNSKKTGVFLSSMKAAGLLGVRKSTTVKNLQKKFVNEYFPVTDK